MIHILFGSPIFVFDHPEDNTENISLEIEKISSNFKKLPLFNPWSGNILTTFSQEDNNNIIKNFCPLLNSYILKSTHLFLKELQVQPNYSVIDIYDSWINYGESGMYQETHSHPYADISGVFYSQAEENCGDIYFIAPSSAYCHSELIFRSKILTDNIKIQPKKNRLILFPSWLQHGTLPNKSNDTRVSISFNIKLIP
jgi:uncharacterized protein (TIGR02466 family)